MDAGGDMVDGGNMAGKSLFFCSMWKDKLLIRRLAICSWCTSYVK